jgi:hypothetical protein
MTDGSPFLSGTRVVPGSPEPGGFDGPFRGIVTNTTDPAGLNRIKAVVPQLFGNSSTEIDWALPCQPPGYVSMPPSPGQGVWIMFEGGDINYPVWMGMWQGEPGLTPYDLLGSATTAAAAAQAASDPSGTAAAAEAAAIATSEAYTTAQLAAYVPLSANPSARIHFSAGQSIASGGSKLTSSTTDWAVGGMTVSSDAITVPVAGKYRVSGAVPWPNNTNNSIGGYGGIAQKNGSNPAGGGCQGMVCGPMTSGACPSFADEIILAVNDVMSLLAYQLIGGPASCSAGGWLAVSLVSI